MDRTDGRTDDHGSAFGAALGASADCATGAQSPGTQSPDTRNSSPQGRRNRAWTRGFSDDRTDSGAIAAIDLGTNNCRLLVARKADDGFAVIDAFSRIVRLGEGVARLGRLSDEAMDRTVSALAVCANKLRRRSVGPGRSRAVATEACRRAVNFPEFRERVNERVGIDLEVISALEEARLALGGCAPLLDPQIPHALVFDIGGGSTEIMWLTVSPNGTENAAFPPAIRLIDSISLPVGVVSLSERHGGQWVSQDLYKEMIAEVTGPLAWFEERHGIRSLIMSGEAQILGSSGTVTTLAGVSMGLRRYDRSLVDGTFLATQEARTISRNLLAMSVGERCCQPCIGRDRGDLVISGCAILEAILDQWPAERFRVADRGVREGILYDLVRSHL
ncbi:Ppx/GppA phosphatase family protein [Fodinicurvata sp. EGI_FJ10296]|uniref:Ppx/GppA phosphatase family protein n=1 Tax=Fodinicurvata sp. EGI_FJ10296 TaxID=3231908 RepID=UPI0034537165